MATTKPIKNKIQSLKTKFDILRKGRESLLVMVDEAEVAEAVYNSNAIENSTLTLKETEKILLEMEVARDVSVREVFEAKNLARVIEYIRKKASEAEINKETILFLHKMLIGGIDDGIAGRFRKLGEYVRVGTHVAPAPEHVERMIDVILSGYTSDMEAYFIDKIAKFHLDFENIHPFCDGNGRIGRLLITLLLCQKNVLSKPLLYLSAFFEKRRQEYYDTLLKVSSVGAWQEWIVFFLQAVAEQSGDAVSRSRHLLELLRNYTQIARENHLPPTSGQLVELIFMKPVLNTKTVQEYLKVSYPSAQNAINSLEDAGILTEITGRKRAKAYSANEVLKALDGEIAPG